MIDEREETYVSKPTTIERVEVRIDEGAFRLERSHHPNGSWTSYRLFVFNDGWKSLRLNGASILYNTIEAAVIFLERWYAYVGIEYRVYDRDTNFFADKE